MSVGINLMVISFFTQLITGKPFSSVVVLLSNLKGKVLRPDLNVLYSVVLGWLW